MNAGMLKDSTIKWTRRLAVPMLAAALAVSFVTYEFAKPASARAAEAAPAAAPLAPTASAHFSPSTKQWKLSPPASQQY